MDKYIRNGYVAVLVSAGHGAGWSTWNPNEERMLFDPQIVEMLIHLPDEEVSEDILDQLMEYCEAQYPDRFCAGADGLYIKWVPQGAAFQIREYDGHERLELRDATDWKVA